MTSRRRFLGTAVAGGFFATSRSFGRSTRYEEIEGRIARRDFKNLTKEDLPTPCMVVDLEIFERNLNTMAEHCRKTGIQLRGHVKGFDAFTVILEGQGTCAPAPAHAPPAAARMRAADTEKRHNLRPAPKLWRVSRPRAE